MQRRHASPGVDGQDARTLSTSSRFGAKDPLSVPIGYLIITHDDLEGALGLCGIGRRRRSS